MASLDSKLNEFNRRLQQRTEDCDNICWDTLITEFFEDDAVLTVTFTDEGPKRYSNFSFSHIIFNRLTRFIIKHK